MTPFRVEGHIFKNIWFQASMHVYVQVYRSIHQKYLTQGFQWEMLTYWHYQETERLLLCVLFPPPTPPNRNAIANASIHIHPHTVHCYLDSFFVSDPSDHLDTDLIHFGEVWLKHTDVLQDLDHSFANTHTCVLWNMQMWTSEILEAKCTCAWLTKF